MRTAGMQEIQEKRYVVNRREFLKYSFAAALGLGFPMLLPSHAQAARLEKPSVRRYFLQFTEHEERPSTDFLVIHHTGFPSDKDSTAEEIHRFHQGTMKWAGIGYHYLIRKDGTIEQGRWPDLVGAHALGHNTTSVGICLAGNFNLARPTGAQMASLCQLAAWLCQEYKLNPLKRGVIVGHRDLNDTDCPGKNLYSLLKGVRQSCQEALFFRK